MLYFIVILGAKMLEINIMTPHQGVETPFFIFTVILLFLNDK